MSDRRRDNSGLLYALVVAVLVALLLSLTGCDPCARLSRRCPPAATVQDSVYVRDSVWVERWRVDTVVRVRLERETIRETVRIGDRLWRVRQAHTVQKEWRPCLATVSLWERIDREHAGTMEDPIPYEPPMEIFAGKYYTQDCKTYRYTRDSGQALSHNLAELVGTYVEKIS